MTLAIKSLGLFELICDYPYYSVLFTLLLALEDVIKKSHSCNVYRVEI